MPLPHQDQCTEQTAHSSPERGDRLEPFFQELRWSRTAPAALQSAAAHGEMTALAMKLAEHLAARRRPRGLSVISTGSSPYFWSLSRPMEIAAPLQQIIGADGARRVLSSIPTTNGRTAGGFTLFTDQRAERHPRTDTSSLPALLALLCAADLLVGQPEELTPAQVLTVLRQLLATAADAAEKQTAAQQDDLTGVVLGQGELPWSVAVLLPEITSARRLATPARRTLACALRQLCNRDGVPHAKYLPSLPLLLASLTRCLWLARETKQALWNRSLAGRWRALLTNALRLCRPDGTLSLAISSAKASGLNIGIAPKLHPDLIEKMLDLTPDSRSRTAWAIARGTRVKGRTAATRTPEPTIQSDDAQLAVLRTQWKPGASMLAVRHDRQPVEFELGMLGEPVLSGPWNFQLRVDGRILESPSDCQVVCWMADHDVIYLELSMKWPAGVVLERQMLISRTDPFALLADSIKSRRRCSLSYAGHISTAGGLAGRTDRRSRISCLQRAGKRRCWLVPLALEQWRVQRSAGTLEVSGEGVRLHATSSGKRLYVPLLIHAYPSRSDGIEWQSLTVTESRRIIRPDTAVAYRVRFDRKRQLLLYRSLGPRGTRAVLGYQTNCEFVLSWFDGDGDVAPLLLVT